MVYYVKYNQPVLRWEEPLLSQDEKAAMGERVAQLGKAHFRGEFRKGKWLPKGDPETKARAEASRAKHPILLPILQIALLLGLIVAAIFAPRQVLPILAFGVFIAVYMWGYYLVTFAFALRRFDRWLSDCLQCYRQSLSKGGSAQNFSDNPEPSSQPSAPAIHSPSQVVGV